eukprot:3426504-Rhodomonas_salina.7
MVRTYLCSRSIMRPLVLIRGWGPASIAPWVLRQCYGAARFVDRGDGRVEALFAEVRCRCAMSGTDMGSGDAIECSARSSTDDVRCACDLRCPKFWQKLCNQTLSQCDVRDWHSLRLYTPTPCASSVGTDWTLAMLSCYAKTCGVRH